MVLDGGGIKLLDFGLAKVRGRTADAAQDVVGTPSFMPPEQALGVTKKVDAQSDVWALGATLFYALSGQPVHLAKDVTAMMLATASTRPRSLADAAPELPRPIVEVIDKAIAYRKANRWPDIGAMRSAWHAARPTWLPTLPPPSFTPDPTTSIRACSGPRRRRRSRSSSRRRSRSRCSIHASSPSRSSVRSRHPRSALRCTRPRPRPRPRGTVALAHHHRPRRDGHGDRLPGRGRNRARLRGCAVRIALRGTSSAGDATCLPRSAVSDPIRSAAELRDERRAARFPPRAGRPSPESRPTDPPPESVCETRSRRWSSAACR